MFVLKHHLPGRYGTAPLPGGTRARATVEREAAANCPVCKRRGAKAGAAAQAAPDAEAEGKRWLDDLLRRYVAKVRSERHYRLSGQIVAADYALRQLTHIELILDLGGRSSQLIDLWSTTPGSREGEGELFASALSEHLDRIRRQTWQAAGDPPRPPLRFPEKSPGSWLEGGPTHAERERARRNAERRIAEAQREWEAAQREDSWEEWKRGSRLSEA